MECCRVVLSALYNLTQLAFLFYLPLLPCLLIYSVCATDSHGAFPMCQALCCVLIKPPPFSLPESCRPSRLGNISTSFYTF